MSKRYIAVLPLLAVLAAPALWAAEKLFNGKNLAGFDTYLKEKVTFKVNGKVVNEGTDAKPSRGRILFQSKGAEVYFRNIELRPLGKR